MDATAIQMHLTDNITLEEEQLVYADADKDGEVSVMDATAIQMYLVGLIEEL